MKLPAGGFLAFIAPPSTPARLPAYPSPAFEVRLESPSFQVNLACFSTAGYYHDEARGITIVLYGHVCGAGSAQQLLEMYLSLGQSFYRALNGSYVVLIVDERREMVVVVMDRTGSRPAHIAVRDGGWLVSTSLESMVRTDSQLDPIGLAWYLANGFIYNRRTLFQEIHRLDHASAVEFEQGRVKHIQYWDYIFTNEFAGKDHGALKDELSRLVVESVRRRIPSSGPAYISLSYGYESSAILAILKKKLDFHDIRTISYGLNETNEVSDPYLARGLARELGVDHTFIPSYDGDLEGVIETNALWWDGVSNFCDEAYAWKKIEEIYGGHHDFMFTGEENFGASKRPASNYIDMFWLFVRNFDNLGRAVNCFPAGPARAMREGMKSDRDAMLRRIPTAGNLWEAEDFFVFDQMEPIAVNPWRHEFTGRVFEVLQPFQDMDILEFMKKMPAEGRDHGDFWHETISAMFPEIYAHPRAELGGYVPDWKMECSRKRGEIAARYINNGRSSQLDAFIPPAALMKILAMQDEAYREEIPIYEKLLGKSRRAANKILGRKEKYKKQVKSTVLLLRCLVLRRFLERLQDEAAPLPLP